VIPRAAPRRGGLALVFGLASSLVAADAAADSLAVIDGGGTSILTLELPPDGRWCLVWNHSVTGIEVADCFRAGPGGMVLESSRQPDFAAGLGDLPGEGRVRSDGEGGYLIDGLARPVPATGLPLRRAGPAVAQRLLVGGEPVPLPPGPHGERLLIRLEPTARRRAPARRPTDDHARPDTPRPRPSVKKPGEQCLGCGGGERPAADRPQAIGHARRRARTRAHDTAPTGASRTTGPNDRRPRRATSSASGAPPPAASR
jgi:hypothetical protein